MQNDLIIPSVMATAQHSSSGSCSCYDSKIFKWQQDAASQGPPTLSPSLHLSFSLCNAKQFSARASAACCCCWCRLTKVTSIIRFAFRFRLNALKCAIQFKQTNTQQRRERGRVRKVVRELTTVATAEFRDAVNQKSSAKSSLAAGANCMG